MTSASIVLYKTEDEDLTQVLDSLINSSVSAIYLIDNSPTDVLSRWKNYSEKITYIFTGNNLGYGSAHNIAIKKSIEMEYDYHIVVNPDIQFETGMIENIEKYMDENNDVGLLMPKMLGLDGKIRPNRYMLPTPLNVFGKFLLQTLWYKKIENKYRTAFYSYDKPMKCPFLAGCFVFLRISELIQIGCFDERFFMYFEDTDLTRRFYYKSVSLYYPDVQAIHIGNLKSHRNIKLFLAHIKSAIQYFNKYGWFFDKERTIINKQILSDYR